jgi:hypothetical protein
MTATERIIYTRAAYHIEWLCMHQGSPLQAWLNLLERLKQGTHSNVKTTRDERSHPDHR